ncbi:MAG TPA: Glu/Leu/Phe/Val dehydrogenase dimerization domain-containing protein [Thermoanaerobaculia bacterium]|nr:Glu/Leu/Phe/Val dehydrogenase dimerization domain-containing protein [Thermoanaerobaculia bacterium]
MRDLTPQAFATALTDAGIRRAFLAWDAASGTLCASHPLLDPLARLLAEDRRDFDRHEGIFLQVAPDTGVLQAAFVHRTCRGQGSGGLRFWRYDTMEDFLRDGLRLSRGMTHKNALAGIWWGGGKGVIARGTGRSEEPEARRRIFEEYGAFLSGLNGCYVSAEDAGTVPADIATVFSASRFVTCIPPALGGSGNPSAPTARGVVRGMEAALAHLGMGTLEGKSVAVQGLGHVGDALIGYLAERGVRRIVGSDVSADRVTALVEKTGGHPNLELDLRVVERGDDSILAAEADLLAPCATGGTLSPRSIPGIQAKIVCGAANNQLEDPERDDQLLAERGILYLPDFLVNRMGIVNCADEAFGSLPCDPRIEAHLGDEWDNSIYNLSLAVLKTAQDSGKTPARLGLDLAEKRSFDLHPIWGHRGAQIIASLVAGGWAGPEHH